MSLVERFIVHAYPWFPGLALAALLALSLANARAVLEEARAALGRRGAWLLALACAAGLALRLGWVPRTHQVYFDEFEHLDIARNLSRYGAFALSVVGGHDDFTVFSAPYLPGGYHTLLGLAFSWAGFSEATAYRTNALLGGATLLPLGLAAAWLFPGGRGSFWAALFLGLLPSHLQFSGCTDTTAASLFWLSFSLMALLLHLRRRDGRSYLLLLGSLACAAHTRYENILLVPLLVGHLRLSGLKPPFSRSRSLALHAGLGLLLLPLAVLLWRNISEGHPGYADSPAKVLGHLASHLPANLMFFLRGPEALLLLLALAWPGLRANPRGTRLLAATAASFFLFYSAYHIGDFSRASGNRYSLAVTLPLTLLASGALASLARPWMARGLAAAFLALAWPDYGRISDPLREREYRFLQEAVLRLPKDLYVVSYLPGALIAAGRPSVRTYFLLEQRADFEQTLERQGRPRDLVLFKDYWWQRRLEESRRLEAELSRNFDFEEIVSDRIGGEPRGFYLLKHRGS